METAPVFLCLPTDLPGEDWDRVSAAFLANRLMPIKLVSPAPDALRQRVEDDHPAAAVFLPEWEPSGTGEFPIDLFNAAAPLLPTVSVITREAYPWLDRLFQPPLHEYITAPFDGEELASRVRQVIEANKERE